MNKVIIALIIAVADYILLLILSLIFYSEIEADFIGMWGLITGFIMLIGALPLHKITYFGGRGIMGSQTPEIPPDEHLHHKIHKQYEKEQKNEIDKNKKFQDVLTIAGVLIIIVSIFSI